MKRFLTCIFAALAVVAASADDCSKMGLKGGVSEVRYGDSRYTSFSNGALKEAVFIEASGYIPIHDITPTSGGFRGTFDGEPATMTVSGGRITKLSYKDYGTDYTDTFTYNADGSVSKVTETKIWYEDTYQYHDGNASVNTNNAATYKKKYQEALKKGNNAEAKKYLDLYNKAAKNASVSVKQSSVTTRRERRTSTTVATFRYTEHDSEGNWTECEKYKDGYYDKTYSRTISYTPEYISEKMWKKDVEPLFTISSLEKFYASNVTYAYKDKAKTEWNNRIMDHLSTTAAGDLDKYVDAANNAMVTPATREKISDYVITKVPTQTMSTLESLYSKNLSTKAKSAIKQEWNRQVGNRINTYSDRELISITDKSICSEATNIKVRDHIYYNRVMRVRDYRTVASFAEMKGANGLLFDAATRTKIQERSTSLLNDSLSYLRNKMHTEMSGKLYSQVSQTANNILAIRSYDTEALQTRADAQYLQLKQKEKSGNITETDYENFLTNNTRSSYTTEIQNTRALFASDLFNKYTSTSEMSRVYGLPMDAKTKKKVSNRIDHIRFVQRRDGFFHIGISADYHAGTGMSGVSGGVGMRLGWTKSPVNVYLGAEVETMGYPYFINSGTNNAYDAEWKYLTEGGYLKGARISVPVQLRYNFARGYRSAGFISAGATYNIPIRSRFCYAPGGVGKKEWSGNDKHLMRNGVIAPRVGIGAIMANIVELEVYGQGDIGGTYDEEYIAATGVKPFLSPNYSKKQFNGKWRLGFTFRILFGKKGN